MQVLLVAAGFRQIAVAAGLQPWMSRADAAFPCTVELRWRKEGSRSFRENPEISAWTG
jgi:hypothetical protein